MSGKKRWAILLLAGMMVFGTVFTAKGAQEEDYRKKITKIKLFIDSKLVEDGETELSVRTNSQQYTLSSYEFADGDEEFEAGDEPKIKIYIDSEEPYYFPERMSKSKVLVSGGTCTSLKVMSDETTVLVTVKLKPVEGTLKDVKSAWWGEGSPGKANWEPVENAGAYELKLYRGNTMVDHKEKVSATNCNFYPKMDRQGTYTFKVRAVPRDSGEKKYLTGSGWTESGEQEIDKQQAQAAPRVTGNTMSGENQSSSGNSGSLLGTGGPGTSVEVSSPGEGGPKLGWTKEASGWRYYGADGSFTSNGWQFIEGKWYLFDMTGHMLTGWQRHGENEYYLTSNGDMVTGWYQEGKKWFYFSPDGAKQNGWVQDGENIYFLGPDGVMVTGWIKWNNQYYYLNPADGRMLRNAWVDRYYINADGICVR